MAVQTVLGTVDAGSLGITLPHEHLFIDIRNQFSEFSDPEKRRLSEEKVQITNLGALRRNPYAVRDNLVLDDVDLCVEELSFFKRRRGSTVVDCTSVGIHRSALRLKEVAQRSGLNIIAGCGYYTQDTHPAAMAEMSAEAIAEEMVRDLTVGVDGTGVKAGVIGEIGTSDPIHPDEWKNLLAAALAFRETGIPIQVHTYPWGRTGAEAADFLIGKRVDPAKIVICHIDVDPNTEYVRSLLERGVLVEFDDFGKEFYVDPADRAFASGSFALDIERVRLIRQLVDWGYAQQILLTNDLCLKSMLRAYGGWGYGHILEHIVPMLGEQGIAPETINTMLIDNPARLLDSRVLAA